VNSAAANTGNTIGAAATVTISCPTGTKLISGGAQIAQTGNTKAALAASFPSSNTVWTGTAIVTVGGTGQATITAFALCTAP
jgi:hypothetical protein